MTSALYPGSFDPIHNGHVDIVERAALLFDEIVVAVYDTPSKRLLFTTEERFELARLSLAHVANVRVVIYQGLTVEAARELGTQVIVRGLRATSDYEYEAQLAQTNKALAPEIEVVCLFTSLKHAYLSSSILKEVAALHGDYAAWVSQSVYRALQAKYEGL
jgi:pantetheine-phosphate adenylyltransferase